jgi:hypothetical protein
MSDLSGPRATALSCSRRTMARLLSVTALLSLFGTTGCGAKMSSDDYAPILAFAADFSGNDAELVAKVRQMAANPPTDIETIGFYGAEDDPPRNRLFLATVNLLDTSGKLSSVEDKYTTEIFFQWKEDGVIDPKALPPVAKAVFGPLMDEKTALNEQAARDYLDYVWTHYAEATQELERHIAEHGKTLLSIDATSGDTLLFALVTPDIAARWRDRALSEHAGYRAGVRSPMWDRFWDHLSYSAFDRIGGRERKGLPPGTQPRVEAIPFAQ